MIVAPVAADNRIDSGDDPRASHSSPAARAPSRTSTMWLKPDSATWERRSATHHPPAPLPLSVPPLLPKRSTQKAQHHEAQGTGQRLALTQKNRCHTALPGRGRRPIKSVIFRFCDAPPGPSSCTTPPPSPQRHPPRRRCWVLVEHFRISQAKGTSAEQRYVPFLS